MFALEFTPKRHVRELHCMSHQSSLKKTYRIHIKEDKDQRD